MNMNSNHGCQLRTRPKSPLPKLLKNSFDLSIHSQWWAVINKITNSREGFFELNGRGINIFEGKSFEFQFRTQICWSTSFLPGVPKVLREGLVLVDWKVFWVLFKSQYGPRMATTEVLNGINACNGHQDERFSLSKALESANRLLIHGGNIAQWNRTKRKTTPNPSDEVSYLQYFCCVMASKILPLTSWIFLISTYNHVNDESLS